MMRRVFIAVVICAVVIVTGIAVYRHQYIQACVIDALFLFLGVVVLHLYDKMMEVNHRAETVSVEPELGEVKGTPVLLTPEYIEGSGELPEWFTQEYVAQCEANGELQRNWEPKVGDWYFCMDLYKFLQITNLDGYYSEGGSRGRLASDHGKDALNHWMCDIYLPDPES